MRFLIAFCLIAPPSFMAGWWANTLWKTKLCAKSRRRQSEGGSVNLSDRFMKVLIGLMAATVIISVIYTHATVDDKLAASETRQIAETRKAVACIGRTLDDFLEGNQELRDASAKRDQAQLQAFKRFGDPVAVDDFEKAQDALDSARMRYGLPDFEKVCGEVAKEFQTSIYDELASTVIYPE
jgi:hypothetical protein